MPLCASIQGEADEAIGMVAVTSIVFETGPTISCKFFIGMWKELTTSTSPPGEAVNPSTCTEQKIACSSSL